MAAPSIDENSPITSFTHAQGVNEEIRALTFHAKWGSQGVGTGATVYYSFPVDSRLWSQKYQSIPRKNDSPEENYPDFVPAYSAQIDTARSVFQAWSNVANLAFIEVETETRDSVGDIRLYNLTFLNGGAAFGVSPIEKAPWSIASGDVGFDLRYFESDPDAFFSEGNLGYWVMLHELGHTLGLSHSFEEVHDVESLLSQDHVALPAEIDHFQYTVMSYFDGPSKQFSNYPTYFPSAPMLLDIQAVQYLYGPNTSYHIGDNVYAFGQSYAYEAIWDAGGNDTIENIGVLNSCH